ncbi:MAG: DUF4097 family beta strand repeat protein [Treponema sp.]|nr:DUF4097 family beta strand repeat protein [Treponema sp.]MBQ2553040.1 DUF4097 family beta strand repeat protein [Treponema sp.]MBQ4236691.1 DUF4097 family beta strand repeat protein [Treponema sp.]MBQ5383978.1 DUF4097 family beta strand repeat protein [Treponema sp.]
MKRLLASILAATAIAGAAIAQGTPQLQTVSAQKGIQVNGLKKIQISLKGERLTITENESSEDKTLSIEILSNYTSMYPIIKNDGKVIKIEQKDNTNKLKDRICDVNISIPKDFKIHEFRVNSESSVISISDLTAQVMEVTTQTGSIKLSKINATEFNSSSDKGDINARDIKVDKTAKFTSSNGSMVISGLTADEIVAETQKGTVRITDLTVKKASVNADKGSLDITFSRLFDKDSTIRVSSGNAMVYLPSNSTFWTSGSVDRGRFRSEFTQDSKGPLLNIKVGGGDMQLVKGSGL